MSKTIRKNWPKIRIVTIKGETFYQVDARKTGTNAKREHFKVKKEAEKRASELAGELTTAGVEGFSLTYEKRSIVLEAERLLAPYGSNILEAVKYFIDSKKKVESLTTQQTIKTVAYAWYTDKAHNPLKKLRPKTCKDILQAYNRLDEAFGTKKITEPTKEDFEKYLKGLDVSQRRLFNLRSLFSQFFNWAIEKKYCMINPLEEIEICVDEKDVEIYQPETIVEMFKVLKKDEHVSLLPYYAILTFAGLRPTEGELLTWENIHLEEKQITVLGRTSKVKETRNVPIEENLLEMLKNWKGKKTGNVLAKKNQRPNIDAFKLAAGFNCEDGIKWIPDGLRHTYASYWLGKNSDRAKLAENMGTSLKMITKHYKKIVKQSDVQKFWEIR